MYPERTNESVELSTQIRVQDIYLIYTENFYIIFIIEHSMFYISVILSTV